MRGVVGEEKQNRFHPPRCVSMIGQNLLKCAVGLEAINCGPRTRIAECLPDVNDFEVCQFGQLIHGKMAIILPAAS